MARSRHLVLAAITVLPALVGVRLITRSPVVKDLAPHLLMAVNLRHSGTMSDADQAAFRPSIYREPLTVVVSATVVGLVDALRGKTDSVQYFPALAYSSPALFALREAT